MIRGITDLFMKRMKSKGPRMDPCRIPLRKKEEEDANVFNAQNKNIILIYEEAHDPINTTCHCNESRYPAVAHLILYFPCFLYK